MMATAAGGGHSAAVGEDGALFVWGRGQFGQLGTGGASLRSVSHVTTRGEPAVGVARPELAVVVCAPHEERTVLADGSAVMETSCCHS